MYYINEILHSRARALYAPSQRDERLYGNYRTVTGINETYVRDKVFYDTLQAFYATIFFSKDFIVLNSSIFLCYRLNFNLMELITNFFLID